MMQRSEMPNHETTENRKHLAHLSELCNMPDEQQNQKLVSGPLCVGVTKPLALVDSVCDHSVCEKFPEALCIPDLCTGQARFFDVTNKQEVRCTDSEKVFLNLHFSAIRKKVTLFR